MINAENFVNSFHGNSDEIFILSNAKKKKKKKKKKENEKSKKQWKSVKSYLSFCPALLCLLYF